MRKFLAFITISIILVGCVGQSKPEVLAKINNYEISPQEFEEEFKASPYAKVNTIESRKEFLNNIVNRVLILEDAQKNNLDKGKNFLKMIQRFWEQSLLKLALDKKSQEIAGSVQIIDRNIEEVYKKLIAEGKTTKTYEQMYKQIKWEITKAKETQSMNDWINQLNKKADIKINYDLLKKK